MIPDVPSLCSGGVREGTAGTAVCPIPAIDVVEESIAGMSESGGDANVLVLANDGVLAVRVVLDTEVIR